MSRELSIFHIIFLYVMSSGILNHVIIISPLYAVAGRDAWLSIFFAFFIYLLWVIIIYKVIKTTNKNNIYTWISNNSGKTIAKFIYFLIFIYLFMMCAITMKDMIIWTNSTFLTNTPIAILSITFLLITVAMANTNIKTIAIVNGILLPIVIVLGFFIATVNMPKKDYSLLFPIFEYGFTPILLGSIYVALGMAEVIIVIFLQHHIKGTVKYSHFMIMRILCTWLTLGPVAGGIATFGPVKSSLLLFPAYEQWALGSISRFIEHFDFFSIYQWLSGAFVRISLYLYIIVDMIQIERKYNKRQILFILSCLLLIINIIPLNYNSHFTLLGKYLLPSLLVLLLTISFMLAAITLLYKRRNRQHEQTEIHNS